MTLPSTTPRISRSLPGLVSRSLLIPVAVVATSLGLAALLHPDPVLYVLLSAPVAILVQVLRRRPLRAAWVRCAPPIKITPRLLALTLLLAIGPLLAAFAAAGKPGAGGGSAWLYAGVAALGALPAAYAIRAGGWRGLRQTVGLLVGMVSIGAVVLLLKSLGTPGPVNAWALLLAVSRSWLLYFPACFLIEEYLYRGVLQSCVPPTRLGAVAVSALWGVWHLPLGYYSLGWVALPYLVGVHVVLGVPLALLTRRTGRLTDAAAVHAAFDAIRNAAMLI